MDIFLPHLNGIDVTLQLRRNKNKVGNPVIIYIKNDSNPARYQMCLDAGMNDILCKPVGPEQILAAIMRYF
jgi:CheY-like chemotaxis protein